MRIPLALYLLGLCLLLQGCSPLAHVARTIVFQPTEFPRRLDDLVDDIRNKELAATAWEQYQAEHADLDYPLDFALGFKAGYADYLYAGGSGAPPPVPPRFYWRPEFESPQGHLAIRDWFAGFRSGALAARLSGFRELVIVPASTRVPSQSSQAGPGADKLPEPPATPDGVLPPPRKMPAAAAKKVPEEAKSAGVPQPAPGKSRPATPADSRRETASDTVLPSTLDFIMVPEGGN